MNRQLKWALAAAASACVLASCMVAALWWALGGVIAKCLFFIF